MKEFFFNIHGIVRFRIGLHSKVPGFLGKRLIREYGYFSCSPLAETDFSVEIGPFSPGLEGAFDIEAGSFRIKEGYLFCRDSYKLARWAVELSGLESGPVRARIAPNYFGYLFVGGYIIDFLIRYTSGTKGYPFVHASALTRNGAGVLFPARSGSGKTTVAMGLMKIGWNLLGDNFVILGQKEVLSFPSCMNIFYYNLSEQIQKRLSSPTLLVLKLKHMLYRLSLGYAKIFTPVSVTEIFPGRIEGHARLDAVYLFLPGDHGFGIEDISREDMIRCLVLNNQLDGFPFYNYILEYMFIYPGGRLSRHWDRLEQNLRSILTDDVLLKRVRLPREITPKVLGALHAEIENQRGGGNGP